MWWGGRDFLGEVFKNGVLSAKGNFMQISASFYLSGSEWGSRSMQYGECLDLLLYFLKHLASISYYYDFNRECMDSYNNTDIGLQPASGLKSPSLSETEIEEESSAAQRRIRRNQLLNTRNIASKETKALKTKACVIF